MAQDKPHILTREDIDKTLSEPFRIMVSVPELFRTSGNGVGQSHIYVRELTIEDCRFAQQHEGDELDKIVILFCLSACDAGGTLFYDARNPADTKIVARLPIAAVRRCADKAVDISGLTDAGREELQGK